MYLENYNLEEKPFQVNTDKRFLWFGDSSKEIVAALKKAILANRGIVLLTGNIGTGKSTIIDWIADTFTKQSIIAKIDHPDLEPLDFFNFLSDRFKIDKKFESKSAFLVQLRNFLRNAYASQKNILLIFDDAHRIKTDLLKELGLLSDIEIHHKKMIAILLAGRNDLLKLLNEEKLGNVADKIATRCHLKPFAESETSKYIIHRLKIAGAKRKIFDQEAIREIHSFSKGNLRLINTMCERALTTAHSDGMPRIDAFVIKNCRKELALKFGAKNRAPHLQALPTQKENQKAGAYRSKEHIRKKLWPAAFLIFLVILSGYLWYNLRSPGSPRWAPEEIAPQQYNFPALEKKEDLMWHITWMVVPGLIS